MPCCLFSGNGRSFIQKVSSVSTYGAGRWDRCAFHCSLFLRLSLSLSQDFFSLSFFVFFSLFVYSDVEFRNSILEINQGQTCNGKTRYRGKKWKNRRRRKFFSLSACCVLLDTFRAVIMQILCGKKRKVSCAQSRSWSFLLRSWASCPEMKVKWEKSGRKIWGEEKGCVFFYWKRTFLWSEKEKRNSL